MYSKTLLKSAVSVLGVVFALSLCIGFSGSIAMAIDEDDGPLCPDSDSDKCCNNDEFTKDFRWEECKFRDKGENPYFILKPGYGLVLEGEEEEDGEGILYVREEVTVLRDKKKININGRKIKTRVVEERAMERESEEDPWKTVEISRNWFAICKETNDVYYFGEDSKDCDLEVGGFDPEDDTKCADESDPDPGGSWEVGVIPEGGDEIAMPGIIMPGTFLLGSRYFQEYAPPNAVDRAEHVAMGVSVNIPDLVDQDDCVEVVDTNPAEGECEDDDAKTYCPGIGIVKDQELELVGYGKGGKWEGEQEGDN